MSKRENVANDDLFSYSYKYDRYCSLCNNVRFKKKNIRFGKKKPGAHILRNYPRANPYKEGRVAGLKSFINLRDYEISGKIVHGRADGFYGS